MNCNPRFLEFAVSEVKCLKITLIGKSAGKIKTTTKKVEGGENTHKKTTHNKNTTQPEESVNDFKHTKIFEIHQVIRYILEFA